MRAIHAVRELNDSRDDPIRVIALYSEPERHALFVRQADERYCIGPASAYLDYEALERALTETKADAAWVGWGFVAEHPAFAELCERLGIVFAGPDAEVMRKLGDKIEAKKLAEQAGVPVAPWSGGPVESVEDAQRIADELGFPLMIKAAAGGGGRGMRRVEKADEVANAYERARAEAGQAFGDDSVLMERLVESARHVEVQLMADGQGTVWALGVRDCSYQRRHQKVVEESASPALTAEQSRKLAESAAELAREVGYRGAATVEFLYEPESKQFTFMEVNARLQVEHPVTEVVTGADLVALQLHVAAGGRLEGDPPPSSGHAIEVRLNAEDPARGFSPAPGRISLLRLPTGPGIRVDTGFAEGDTVPADFDSMLAKIIAHGATREQAIARLRRAVADTMVVIDEGTTNQGFLLELLGRPELRAGEVDTGWLDRLQAQGDVEPVRHADAALVQAAIALCDEETAADRAHFYALARRGRPQAEADVGHTLDLLYRGVSYRFAVWETGPHRYRVEVDGVAIEAAVEQLTEHERRLSFGGRSYRTLTAVQDTDLLVEVNGVPHRVSRDEGGLVRAHAPGVVVAIPVSAGDEVQAGDVVAVTESMKMETSLTAPVHGRVREVLVGSNVHVAAGRPLLQIDPLEDAPQEAGERLTFEPAEARHERARAAQVADPRLRRHRRRGRSTARSTPRASAACSSSTPTSARWGARTPPATTTCCAARRSTCTPSCARSTPPPRACPSASSPRSSARSRTTASTGSSARRRWRRPATACSSPSSAPARSAPRSARSWSAGSSAAPATTSCAACSTGSRARSARASPRSPSWCASCAGAAATSRSSRRAARRRTRRWRATSRRSPTTPPDREERMAALVSCPQPLAPLIGRHVGDAGALMEAMTRRYYRIRDLETVEQRLLGPVPFVYATYMHEGVRHHVAATLGDREDLAPRSARWPSEAREVPEHERVLADLYVREGEDLGALLEQADLPANVARAAFVITPSEEVDVVTYFRGDGNWHEYTDLRGMHPMMAARLDFWRLSNFELERLPSAPEVHLFRAVARENPRDERLVALAEVRDLSPVRDESGTITAIPQLERTVRQAFESMRSVQSGRRPRERLLWNRLLLYVWPVMDFGPEDAGAIIERFTRITAELGIELVMVRGRVMEHGFERERVLRFFNPAGRGVTVEVTDPPKNPLQPLDEGAQRIISARRRGTLHPAEIVKTPRPRRVRRARPRRRRRPHAGQPAAGHQPRQHRRRAHPQPHAEHPEGMLRVILLGDPTRSLGSLAEPECRRIIAALDLAEELGVPVEWFAVSSGAKIAMDSGTENMDWVAAALRRIVHFTQAGGEINVIVSGINVGAQPYFNAEATMLMHTRGILVMTPDSAMVLTGKQALDYSGGISAEDNFGIGGYERIMGPNGQAQYWARDLAGACDLLLRYYEHTYVAPGERFPRRADSRDPVDRDVRSSPHHAPDSDLETVGDVFAEETNPGPQEGVRHPLGDAGGQRRRPRAARALGGDARGRGGGGVGRPSRRPAGGADRHRVAAAAALRLGPRRRPGAVDLRHAVPAGVQEGRTRDQRGLGPAAAGDPRQPGRLRRLAGVDAPAPARVRRRDRPRDRQLRRPDRLLA